MKTGSRWNLVVQIPGRQQRTASARSAAEDEIPAREGSKPLPSSLHR